MVAIMYENLRLDPQRCKRSDRVLLETCNPATREAGKGGSIGLASQAGSLNQGAPGSVKDAASRTNKHSRE